MAIEKITKEEENLSPAVLLHIKNDRFGIRIDTKVTPLYCHRCEAQVPGLFRLNGSRYGQVGSINCDCGATIICIDSDNIVDWLDTVTYVKGRELGRLRIDYYELYCLGSSYWKLHREKTGYAILEAFDGQQTTLEDIINLLETRYQLRKDSSINIHPSFPVLPAVVERWIGMIESMK